MLGSIVASKVERLIRDMATTPMVLRSPPTTTEDRLERKRAKLRLTTIKQTKNLAHGHVSVEGSEVLI
jgi:hypothetical protein